MSAHPVRPGECRKFSPNIFNKTKCTNCFRQKEEHSSEALESNRATRKVAKCGYLFVAPGWDFTIPGNRTKRWQRRWFVLYDDGELIYALDEHPETVPQASIDMNKVVEVSPADELTGNPFSLAITAPDHVHFVKGTSREEARHWAEVLALFPPSKGRHKRNATFPGSQPSNKASLLQTPPVRNGGSSLISTEARNQYNSRISSSPLWDGDDVFPTRDTPHDTDPRKVYVGSPPTRDKLDDKERARRALAREKRGIKSGRSFSEDISKMVPTPWSDNNNTPKGSSAEVVSCRLRLDDYQPDKFSDNPLRPRSPALSLDSHHKQIRGDPDGCGLDALSPRYSPSDLRTDLPADQLLNIKKGWLKKQGQEKEWSKHWFVLRGSALLYYRDPTAEDQGILDGVIDLSGVTSVTELQIPRNYGIQITTWDERRYTLSAVTHGIRASWMSAIRTTAGLPHPSPSQLSSPIQESADVMVPLTPRSLIFSSDDEYKTASESGGRRESGSEWGEALPPSPPLNRTPMSRVKERARGVSKLRIYGSKRSRSSPPTSRRSTLDSISSQEISTCLNSPPICEVKSGNELEEVKEELSARLRELSSAQEELQRQRQRQADMLSLEQQVEELSRRADETGKQRARDLAELDALKKRYVEEKMRWEVSKRNVESELEETSSRCANLCLELASSRESCEGLRRRLAELEGRLEAAARENDALYARLQLLSKPSSPAPPPTRSRSLDSLSDLTNIDLDIDDVHALDKDRLIEEYVDMRVRFEKAVTEIRAMKKELRESHAQVDWLELSLVSSRQEMKGQEEAASASNNLMAARIQDLASKLAASEKQIRTLKQKLSKTETRDKRRSLSLKGRESFTISKEFEEKLAELEKRVSNIDVKVDVCKDKKADKLASRIRRKSLDSVTSSEPMKVLLRLNSLEAKIVKASETSEGKQATELKLFSGDKDEVDSQQSEIVNEVKKMENLLRAKLVVLSKKRESLIKAGQWTNEAQLNLLAEKLAYESVLIGRLHDAIVENRGLDTADAERLMSSLDCKLSGTKHNLDTSLDYLVKALAKHLSQQTVKRATRKIKEKKKPDSAFRELLVRKSTIDSKVTSFIDVTVNKLAEVLALESLADGSKKGCKKDYSQAAWSMAQEAVNQELIQEEIIQVMSQCSHNYQRHIECESQSRFVSVVKDRANLELWGSNATENLNHNMTAAMKKLQDAYHNRLEEYKSGISLPRELADSEEQSARDMLQTFADIVAHKSLLDARIAVMSSDETSDSEVECSSTIEENSLLSEIQYLYVKFCKDLSQDSKEEDKLKEIISRIAGEIISLEQLLVPSDKKLEAKLEKDMNGDNWFDNIARKLELMKERIVNIQTYAKDNKNCKICYQLQQKIQRVEQDFNQKIQQIEKRQLEEIAALQFEFEKEKESLIQKHVQEEEQFLETNNKLEKDLEFLTGEYDKQIQLLKSSYAEKLNAIDAEQEDSLHTRYQKEIQHLRSVCEKGLIGMENSHKRQIQELQQKHEKEIESLRLEKEQALAEETHATLAALDAMRKAHEAEVQKEIAKFKAEYLSKMTTNYDISSLHKQHQAEMTEIKHEILSLSEKYSVKCVENASLEDKLKSANQQLAHAHQHILQLDNRCKQLRTQLSEAETSENQILRPLDHSHGVARRPRVVHCIPKTSAPAAPGCQNITPKPDIRKNLQEPPLLLSAELKRSPEMFSLCGMVSKRREEFERRLTAPATCPPTSRVTFI